MMVSLRSLTLLCFFRCHYWFFILHSFSFLSVFSSGNRNPSNEIALAYNGTFPPKLTIFIILTFLISHGSSSEALCYMVYHRNN